MSQPRLSAGTAPAAATPIDDALHMKQGRRRSGLREPVQDLQPVPSIPQPPCHTAHGAGRRMLHQAIGPLDNHMTVDEGTLPRCASRWDWLLGLGVRGSGPPGQLSSLVNRWPCALPCAPLHCRHRLDTIDEGREVEGNQRIEPPTISFLQPQGFQAKRTRLGNLGEAR